MRYVLWVVAVLAALVVIVLVVGWSLPARHTVSRTTNIRATPEAVFALVSNVEAYPAWRTGVKQVEIEASDNAGQLLRFREHGSDGAILFEVTERVPVTRLVTRIADPGLPFGGRWTYEISPAPDGAVLRITEDGEVYNPVFRFVSRFIMGHHATIDGYLRDVTRKLGGSGAIAN